MNLNQKNTGRNFPEIEKNYSEIVRSLETKKAEKSVLIETQVEENSSRNLGFRPQNVRYSSIIENDLSVNLNQISRFLDISKLPAEDFISQFVETLKIPKSVLIDLITKITEFTQTPCDEYAKVIETIENAINDALDILNIQIYLSKYPIFQRENQVNPELGISFILHHQQKLITYSKLSTEEKVFLMWAFDFVLNKLSGFDIHIFHDINYKFKRTKDLLQKTIQLFQDGILKSQPNMKFVILLSKPILEDSTQKDLIITTINPNT